MIPHASQIEDQLRQRYGDGTEFQTQAVIRELAAHFRLTPEDLEERDGSHPRFEHKVHSALARHRKLELLERPRWGWFRYMPEKLAEYTPRRHRSPKAATISTGNGSPRERADIDDYFPIGDYRILAELVSRHGKTKLLHVVQRAFQD